MTNNSNKINTMFKLVCITLVAVVVFGMAGVGFDVTNYRQAVPVETQGIRWFGAGGFALPAAGKVTVDGDTVNQTQTSGAVDINVGTTTADVSALNVAFTQDNGTAADTDGYGAIFTLTQNDADADMRGLLITASNSGVETAGSYEYGLHYNCAVTVAGGCTDGVLFSSGGVASGLTDAIDASAANIDNAINVGANLIMGTDDSLSVGATDDTVILDSNDSDGTYTCTDADANAGCTFTGGGTGITTLGSASSTSANVRGAAFDLDVTGAMSLDADAASNVTVAGAGIDLTIESEAGEVHIKGDEANATGITLDADDAAGTGITANVGATGGFNIAGGKLDVQTGPFTLENDESIINADGSFDFTRNDAGTVTLTASDNDTTAALTVDPGGAADLTLGSADVPNVNIVGVSTNVSNVVTVTSSTATFGVDGAGIDVYFYSDTAGDYGLWDTGGERFVIIGTDGAYALDVQDGDINLADNLKNDGGDLTIGDDAVITGTLNVQGAGDFDSDLNIDGGLVVDLASDLQGDVSDSLGDFTIADNVVITGTSDLQGNVSDSGGHLTLADDVDITLGLDVQGGNITLQNDEVISNTTDGTISLNIAGNDEWDFIADELDATLGQIVNIGAANTDFDSSGGLRLAGTLTVDSTSDFKDDIADSAGDLTIADNAVITGTLDVDGLTNLDDVDIDGAVQIDGAVTIGVDGTSFDVILYSDTEGDYFHWDQDAEQLVITGTDTTTVLDIPDGNVVVNDDLTVTAGAFDVTAGATTVEAFTIGADGSGADAWFYSVTGGDYLHWNSSAKQLIITGTNGTTALDVPDGNVVVNDDLTVTAGAFDVTVGATTLEALTTGVDGTGADVIFYSDTSGDYFHWDTSAERLIITGTSAANALEVPDGNVSITNDLDVDGTTNLDITDIDGAVDMDSTLDVAGAVALASDVTLATDPTGGNAGAKTEYIGLPRIKNVGIGTMANGTTNTVLTDIGDSETPATDWTAIDADTVMSNDSSYYRQGTASLKMAIADTADDGDGCTNTLASGDQDWTDDEGFGFWIYSTEAITAANLTLQIHDATAGGGFTDVNLPAITADVWQWVELDVTLANNNLKDAVTDLSITLSAAGAAQAALGAFDVYFDFFVKWDVAEEETLGVAIPYDGVLSLTVIDATDAAASCANIVEYTDYFVHYQSGNDAIVIITDQSDADKVGLALVAYN